MTDDTAEMINIRSTITDDGEPACLLEWGTRRKLMPPDVALNTARELAAAAAHAETDVALIRFLRDTLDLQTETIVAMLADIRLARTGPVRGKTALAVEPIAGATTGLPYVHVHLGRLSGSLSPDTARQMAQHWNEVTVAALLDVRMRHAFKDYPQLSDDDIENIFAKVAHLGDEQEEPRG